MDPPTIDEIDWTGNYLLAPGVSGMARKENGHICIYIINAVSEGSGDVGRFLDELSDRCIIKAVVSPRLIGMLRRRGWNEISDSTWKRERPPGKTIIRSGNATDPDGE